MKSTGESEMGTVTLVTGEGLGKVEMRTKGKEEGGKELDEDPGVRGMGSSAT